MDKRMLLSIKPTEKFKESSHKLVFQQLTLSTFFIQVTEIGCAIPLAVFDITSLKILKTCIWNTEK